MSGHDLSNYSFDINDDSWEHLIDVDNWGLDTEPEQQQYVNPADLQRPSSRGQAQIGADARTNESNIDPRLLATSEPTSITPSLAYLPELRAYPGLPAHEQQRIDIRLQSSGGTLSSAIARSSEASSSAERAQVSQIAHDSDVHAQQDWTGFRFDFNDLHAAGEDELGFNFDDYVNEDAHAETTSGLIARSASSAMNDHATAPRQEVRPESGNMVSDQTAMYRDIGQQGLDPHRNLIGEALARDKSQTYTPARDQDMECFQRTAAAAKAQYPAQNTSSTYAAQDLGNRDLSTLYPDQPLYGASSTHQWSGPEVTQTQTQAVSMSPPYFAQQTPQPIQPSPVFMHNEPVSFPVASIEDEHHRYGQYQQQVIDQNQIHYSSSHNGNCNFYGNEEDDNFVPQTYFATQLPGPVQHSPLQQPYSDATYQFGSEPARSPDPGLPRKARQKRGRRASIDTEGRDNPSCVDCGKKFRLSPLPDRCSRCADKHMRREAGQTARHYNLDPGVPDLATARHVIFTPIEGRKIKHDDYHSALQQPEDFWVQHLLDGVNTDVNGGFIDTEWTRRQQTCYNEKAKLEEKTYSSEQMTARLRALFQEIVNFHTGGPAVYAMGGDNVGYTDNLSLTFQQRVQRICEILARNKRVVMDVVEGRGVQGLVANPEVYNRRKQSNNNCNEEKKRIMEKGKEIEGAVPKKRKRTAASASPDPEVDDGEPGPSMRQTRSGGRLRQGDGTVEESLGQGVGDELEDDEYSPHEEGEYTGYGPPRTRFNKWYNGKRR